MKTEKIMNQEGIDQKLKDSKVGDEVVLHVRSSDLHKGIKLIRTCRTIVFMIHTTIQIELEIDPNDASFFDDRYVLFSTDEAQTYCETLTIKDDKINGDNKITLEYDGVKKDLNYSLKIDLGAGYEPYFLFENMPYKDLTK